MIIDFQNHHPSHCLREDLTSSLEYPGLRMSVGKLWCVSSELCCGQSQLCSQHPPAWVVTCITSDYIRTVTVTLSPWLNMMKWVSSPSINQPPPHTECTCLLCQFTLREQNSVQKAGFYSNESHFTLEYISYFAITNQLWLVIG